MAKQGKWEMLCLCVPAGRSIFQDSSRYLLESPQTMNKPCEGTEFGLHEGFLYVISCANAYAFSDTGGASKSEAGDVTCDARRPRLMARHLIRRRAPCFRPVVVNDWGTACTSNPSDIFKTPYQAPLITLIFHTTSPGYLCWVPFSNALALLLSIPYSRSRLKQLNIQFFL
jgi:hypothetical protein